MKVGTDVVVRYALEPLDFRKSIDGLAMAVGTALGRDPMCGEVFVFRNKRRNALKALYWTPNGFVMLYKRLERGRFTPPKVSRTTGALELRPGRFQDLLEGVTQDIRISETDGNSY